MNMMKLGLLAALYLLGLTIHVADGAGYRILGWKMVEMDIRSKVVRREVYKFGDTSAAKSGESWFEWGHHFCWTSQGDGYCYFKLKLTQQSGRSHYELLGGETKFMDIQSKYTVYTATWGVAGTGQRRAAFAGYTWVGGHYNNWGYAETSFWVRQTTEPPLITAFSFHYIKADERWKKTDPQVHGNKYGASEIFSVEYRSWSSNWDKMTMGARILYGTSTVLKSMDPQWDQKQLISTNAGTGQEVLRERVMINDGCGNEYIEGQTGQLSSTTSISLTETVSWAREFSFGFSVSYEAGFDIGAVSNTVTVSSEFSYSSSEEFSREMSNSLTEEYTWPHVCPPGNKCTVTLYVTKSLYRIPVVFTFERNGETFKVTNEMVTNVESWRDHSMQPEPTGNSCR